MGRGSRSLVHGYDSGGTCHIPVGGEVFTHDFGEDPCCRPDPYPRYRGQGAGERVSLHQREDPGFDLCALGAHLHGEIIGEPTQQCQLPDIFLGCGDPAQGVVPGPCGVGDDERIAVISFCLARVPLSKPTYDQLKKVGRLDHQRADGLGAIHEYQQS